VIPAYTSSFGNNDQAFRNILKLYGEPNALILDATYGKGRFWAKSKDLWLRPVFCDIAPRPGVHLVADAKCLPFADGTFHMAVIDPPYLAGGKNPSPSVTRSPSDMRSAYNLTTAPKGWAAMMKMYGEMIVEAARVSTKYVVVKGQDDTTHWFVRDLPIPAGLKLEDIHVVTTKNHVMMRHQFQKHARKNHSYFMVLSHRRVVRTEQIASKSFNEPMQSFALDE
jgi:hypothetical protein